MAQYDTNPIGALQERFQSRGILPEYKFLQTDGASHCPVFSFQVTVADVTACGSGQTKKQAKQEAAKKMLDILDGRAPAGAGNGQPKMEGDDPTAAAGKPGPGGDTNGVKKAPVPAIGNKIGMLQEYCVTNGLPMPVYEVSNVGGQPHQRVFTILAKVGSLTISGDGTSKKDAKREAATKMYDRLKGLKASAHPMMNNIKQEPGSYPQAAEEIDPELAKLVNEMAIDTVNAKHSKEIQQFYGNLSLSKNSLLYKLHRSGISGIGNTNYVAYLGDLGKEQKFTVTYVDVDEPTDDGEVQCLVQLSSMPVAVCNGLGSNANEAKNSAAKTALLYLKMMTKKKVVPEKK